MSACNASQERSQTWIAKMPTATALRRRQTQLKSDRSAVDAPPPFSVRRFTVEEYHKLIDAGFFSEDERYELLDGWIVPKMPKNPPHEVCIELIQALFARLLPAGWRLRTQSAVTLTTSEPEPDGAVVRGSPRDHLANHPGPSDTALAIEVTDSTLTRDRHKAKIYARDRIPRYWLINLKKRVIEDYSGPAGEGDAAHYKSVRTIRSGEHLSLKLGGKALEVAVDELLP
jgi:Uma2 family endonuclease